MKRFYRQVGVAVADGGWQVTLDGRGVRTAGGRAQIAPTRALAEALAEEWAGQGGEIEPARFVLRDMADFALDLSDQSRGEAIDALLPYAETDTLCYRAEPGEAIEQRQRAVWEPLLAAAEQALGLRFRRVIGIIHRAQPAETIARLRDILASRDAFALAALQALASLAASLVIALAATEPDADLPALWDAASLEEDFQAEMWGHDAQATARRARRLATFLAAARFARLAAVESARPD